MRGRGRESGRASIATDDDDDDDDGQDERIEIPIRRRTMYVDVGFIADGDEDTR